MHARIGAFFVAAALAVTGLAAAQETTGTITGRIVDAQNLAVPGATVTVTGPQGARTFTTDAEGRFQAPFLVPGVYSVRADLSGFRPIERPNVNVSLGQTITLNLQMQVGGLAETVEVTAASPVVDTVSTTTGAILSTDLFSRVPVGRRITDTLYLAPGVSSSSVGRANPSLAGSSGLDNQYVIDGVNITNQGYGAIGSYSIVFGSLGQATPFDFVREVQVKTGGYQAEFGQSMGGVVNVITKSGSNNLRGSFFGYARPSGLEGTWKQLQTTNGAVNTTRTQVSDFGVEGGFPIVRDRLFGFGAINPAWEKRTFVAPDGFPLVSLGEVDRDRRTLSYSAKVTWQAASVHRVDASFFGDPSTGENGPQRGTALKTQNTAQFSALEYGGHNQTVRWDAVFRSNWLVEASFARAYTTLEELPSVNDWNVRDFRVTPNVITGGIGFFETNDGENLQYQLKSTNIVGGHQFKYGVLFEDVDWNQGSNRTGPTFVAPDGRRTATGAQIQIRPDPAFGQIFRVARANFNVTRPTTQTYFSFFVQDAWQATNRLTVNAGVRYEEQTLVGTITDLVLFDLNAGPPGFIGGNVDDFALKGNWAPRVGFAFDVLGGGQSKLFANYGRFFARVPNDLAARALSADEGISRADYFDANLTQPIPNGVLAGGVTNHFILAGSHPAQIDPDAKLSFKDEFVAGYEWEAMPNTSVGIRYIFRTIGRAIEDVALFPMVGYDLGHPDAGGVEYIMTNPTPSFPTLAPELGAKHEDPIHNYNAVELTANRRFADNWMLTSSYRWSRLHGSYEGFFREDNGQSDPGITSLYDFPTNDPSYTAIGVPQFGYKGDIRFLGKLGEGPLPLDRPHQVKVFGNYAFDLGLSLGLGLNLGSGKPLTALAANPAYTNGGEIPLGPRGSGIQTADGFRERTPFESQLDLQASYAFDLPAARRITLFADVFNLFNQRRTLDYDNWTELGLGVANPDFGTAKAGGGSFPQFQQPIQLRVGGRFEF
ncbi:MAG: TonB-dependent receptor [Acidobacteria bacterium]|nr:TonB-dependent receptor [Acidobacteriota bacterium]